MKTIWTIEPRDPLVIRDGRPFGPVPGAVAHALSFPFPSTTSGALRTREGLGPDGRFDPNQIERVLEISVRGPLLVELDGSGEIARWYAPAPADAVLLGGAKSERIRLRRLVPLKFPEGMDSDLPKELSPVGMSRLDPSKPYSHASRFWCWSALEEWLVNPSDREGVHPSELGIGELPLDSRVHVSIQPETLTGAEGMLFRVEGREFLVLEEPQKFSRFRRLALALEAETSQVKPGVAPMAGERRVVFWRKSQRPLPSPPAGLIDRIAQEKACRVILLTPAEFQKGWKPSQLLQPKEGVSPSLVGAVVARPEVVSGWSFKDNRPKPTRRLAPAGSVYFLKLEGESEAIQQWAEKLWMRSVSDTEHAARDGFGLAVLGTWNGKLEFLTREESDDEKAS